MKFYSTNNGNLKTGLKEAVLEGLAKDRGLFMPETISRLPQSFFEHIDEMSFQDISIQISQLIFQDSIEQTEIERMIEKAITFNAPLVNISKKTHILELFHGPSLAFKDFGARFMAQLMAYLIRGNNRNLTILVATSGDTGGAVAQGFYETEGIEVIILYPSGKVSDLQEKQLTTLGKNVTALEIDGTFDDCQAMVKEAFMDAELKQKRNLSSANSINIARLIPQTFYYFRAYQQLSPEEREKATFVVPSGNFGNLTAGLMAYKMGLPVRQFIAATNINDVVPQYLATGVFQPRKSVQTLSNAMDIGNPSNFARMIDLFHKDSNPLDSVVKGYSFNDQQTMAAIRQVFEQTGYIIDPHGAVGWLAFQAYLREEPDACGIILETAHPAKFLETVESAIGQEVSVPVRLETFRNKEKNAIFLPPAYEALKQFLMND
ncbi:MAG: threonine synthase [Bacteroidetes bacterium]|nr:threonine synthase [Bacteroidota bacterium]